MSGIFGGAQTVPTSQNTFQTQTGASTSQSLANPFALEAGQELVSQIGQFQATPIGANVPLLSVVPPTQNVVSSVNNLQGASNQVAPWYGMAGQDINQAAGYFPQASNYIGQGTGLIGTGAGMAQQAGQAITPADINAFQNPFISNVTANLQDIFSQQNTQNLLGSTQAAGGAGSERSAVGQALLAQRQGLTAGNIYADLYQRSLQAAEQQKAQQLAAAQGVIGAGGATVGAGGTTGALGAQLGQLGLGTAAAANQTNALNLQAQQYYQGLLQQPFNAQYQQQLGRYEDPFRRLGAVAGATYPLIGLGQTGTQAQNVQSAGVGNAATTYPAAPLFPQIAGLGLAGAALLAARGGRIKKKHKFDLGGAVDMGQPPLSEDVDTGTGGQTAPMGLAGEGSPGGNVGGFGGPGDVEASSASVTQGGTQPISEQKAIGTPTPEEQSLGKRNQYALMQAMLNKSITGKGGGLAGPQIHFPPMMQMRPPQSAQPPQPPQPPARRQEGGRIPVLKAYQEGGPIPMSPSGTFPDIAKPENVGNFPPMVQAALNDDDDDDDDFGGEAAPLGGAPQPASEAAPLGAAVVANPNPFNRQVTAPGGAGPGFGSGMSPGKLAMLQAGLGMLAASGQRDRHGLPMAPLAAVGAGGMQGVNTYQHQQAIAQRERAAQASLELRKAQLDALNKYRQDTLNSRLGMQPGQLKTIQTPLGPKSVIVQPDGSFKDAYSGKPIGPKGPPSSTQQTSEATSKLDPSAAPAETDEQKQLTANIVERGSEFKTPLNVDQDLLESMQTSPEQFDFMATRLALGDQSILSNLGTRGGAVAAFKQALRSRSQQYWMDKGLGPRDANNAIIELQAQKAGARSLATQEARITGALGRASETAKVVIPLSDKINRTQYPSLNSVILAAKRHTGDEDVVKYGLSMETFIKNYAAATGQGSSVLTDHQYQTMERRLNEAWSKGQVRSVIDQGIIEINRELVGTHNSMNNYLGKTAAPSRAEISEGGDKADAAQWIKDNPNADPKKIERIKQRYGL